MSKPVISVRGLGKKYRLGATIRHDTLRDQITSAFKSLFSRNGNKSAVDLTKVVDQTNDSHEFWALKDVSFDVNQGEVIGIIGRNGAGKSTLLKILSEITEPTTGEIRIRGRVGTLLEVGTGFHPELTGRENIYMNGAILGMTKAEIKAMFDEIVAFSEVEKFLDTPVKRYSSGMYVRLAFAVAAHLNPEILIIDEVLSVGDASFQKKCLGKMDEFANSGRTIIFVSHNMAAIEALCNRSVMLNEGNLLACGPTRYIISNYISMVDIENLKKGKRAGEFFRTPEATGLIRRAILKNSSKERTSQIRLGEPCEFLIDLESSKEFKDLAVGLHIKNEVHQRVTSFHTRYQQCPSLSLNGRLTLKCKCPELMLTPGNYFLELAVASSGRVEDRIDCALFFSIIDANVLGSGKVPPLKDGILVSRGYWELVKG